MKKDIENRDDIDLLMREFYTVAMKDSVIGYIFTDVAKLDLDHHLPIIGDFWDSMLFGTNLYSRHARHPMVVHGELHEMSALDERHFERWLEIFYDAIDRLFEGPTADLLKMRASAIAGRMMNYLGISDSPLMTLNKQ